jgi:peptidoglycan DL-endopeptidase CwlO
MRRRLFALLAVAALSGLLASTAANGRARAASTARIPALPQLPEVAHRCPIPARFRPAFEAAARDTNLPLAMLVAVGQVESGLRPNAVSEADARGLLQVLPSTGAALRLDVNVPRTNVLAGARYLRLLLHRFDSADLALAAYNAGPTAVAAAGGVPSAETSAYVVEVDTTWRSLRGCR